MWINRVKSSGRYWSFGGFFLYFMERAGMVRGRFLRIKELVLVYEYIQEIFASISNRIFRKPFFSHRMPVKICRDSSCKGTRDGINRGSIGID